MSLLSVRGGPVWWTLDGGISHQNGLGVEGIRGSKGVCLTGVFPLEGWSELSNVCWKCTSKVRDS